MAAPTSNAARMPVVATLTGRLPRRAARIAPRFQQIAQLPDVAGGVAVFQAKMGETTLGTTFGGTVEQIVEVLLAQQEHVLDERGLLFGFGHLLSPEMRNPPDA
jgi:hypothetical protein